MGSWPQKSRQYRMTTLWKWSMSMCARGNITGEWCWTNAVQRNAPRIPYSHGGMPPTDTRVGFVWVSHERRSPKWLSNIVTEGSAYCRATSSPRIIALRQVLISFLESKAGPDTEMGQNRGIGDFNCPLLVVHLMPPLGMFTYQFWHDVRPSIDMLVMDGIESKGQMVVEHSGP